MDIGINCPFRLDRTCTAAPFYGTADCEWAIDKEECPEPYTAILSCGEVVDDNEAI